jgi:peptidoglycan/LPS O-acetylase OafA/YrhL
MTENKDRIYFQHFDVIRFVAAFMIVLLHIYEAWIGWYGQIGLFSNGTHTELSTGGQYASRFIFNLGIGVDIFFLLSGFLITYLLLEEKKKFGKINIGKFMLRRAFRIWPLYFLLIAIAPFVVDWVDSTPEPNYWMNCFFLGNFEIIKSGLWTYPFSHFWSICIEEHFYLVWPFIIAFVPVKRLLWVFGAIILISISFRMFVFQTNPESGLTLYLHTFSRMDMLVLGAIGGYFYAQKAFVFKLNRYLRYFLIVLLLFSCAADHIESTSLMFLAGFKKYYYILLIAVLLLDFSFNVSYRHLLKENSIIHYFGKISYGIYMYNNFLILIVIKKIMWTYEITNLWFFIGINIFLSLLIPIISYELYEKHFLKIGKKFRVLKINR